MLVAVSVCVLLRMSRPPSIRGSAAITTSAVGCHWSIEQRDQMLCAEQMANGGDGEAVLSPKVQY